MAYPLIGLTDDVVGEALRHLAGPVLYPLERVIQVALGGGGDHRGDQRPNRPCCLNNGKAKQDKLDAGYTGMIWSHSATLLIVMEHGSGHPVSGSF